MNSYQCYELLGVRNDTPFKEIKSAYRKLALEYHPDKNISERDGKKFKMITEAYQFLRSEHKRMITFKTNTSDNNRKYTEKHSWWGTRPTDRPPEADWTRYTKEAEYAYQDFWKYYEKTFWEYYEKVRGETVKIDDYEQTEKEDFEVSVDVDKSLCIGCCSCELIAPNVFFVDKNARTNPKSNVINHAGAPSDKILDAAQTCPTKAISVTDMISKKQLFPW